jgi:threonine dehydratase
MKNATRRAFVLGAGALGLAGVAGAQEQCQGEAVAIVVRIVRTGNQDPYTVTAHLEDRWVDLVRHDAVVRRDIMKAVRLLVERKP